MAPSRKRVRDEDDVDGDVEVESASSNLRNSGPKRSKIAMARARGGSTVSDEESEEDRSHHTNGFNYDDDNDDSDDEIPYYPREDEDEEIDEIQATQIVTKQIREHRENAPSDSGVIEEVRCRNFMCHGHLRITLGPLINFIIGHNGSGKSAVLTALTMCLGGKATATNRGASLKSLIKEGEESATLSVKIKNKGDSAYKPDVYGGGIIVERHFSRSGTSGFKIKSEENKLITTKKGDLDDILDYFAFQLDNPINVLTQDMARQFLSNSTPSDKYKFFIKGTQLETLDADYQLLEESLDNMEAKLRTRQDDIGILREKAEQAKRKKERSNAVVAIQQKIKLAQRQHAWVQIADQETLLERFQADVDAAQERIDEAQRLVEQSSGTYEGNNQAFEVAQNYLAEQEAQLEPIQQHHAEEKAKLEANTQELSEQKAQERVIKTNLKTEKENVKRLEKGIAEEQARLNEAEGPEHGRRLEQLEELREAARDAVQNETDHRAARADLQRQKDEADEALAAARQPVEQQASALERLSGVVSRLRREQGDQYAPFRPNMSQLVRTINNETRWRQKPVGPLGLHIRLLKPEWSSQLEKTFGGVLDSFIVTCKEDQNLLSQMMKRVNCQPNIFIGRDQHIDTTDNEPDQGNDTILRVLEISNEMVRNQLIINQAIDQTVLIQKREEAQRFMYGGSRPRNVKVAISFGAQRNSGIRFEYARSGSAKSGPVHPWEGPSRMQTNFEEQMRQAKENETRAQRELETLRQNGKAAEQTVKQASQAFVRWQRELKNLQVKKQHADDAVDALQMEIENNRPQDGKLQELQNQLETAKGDVQASEGSYQDAVDWKDRLNDQARELKSLADEALRELNEFKSKIDKARRKKEKYEEDRQRSLHEKNRAHSEVNLATATKADMEERRDTQQQTIVEFTAEARKISERVDLEPGVTAAMLDKRLEKFTNDKNRAEAEAGGTREELTEEWARANQEFRDAQGQLSAMEQVAKAIKSSLTERKYRWKMFRKYISYRARFTFSYLLSERNFRGRVLMDHHTKELDIKVEPDLTRESDTGRKTQTLSGGEKSFSTICLLLAIWEAMGSPIRCLDEFDVFMDSVNRSTSMGMMIQAARRSVGRQFILITPQSMNNVEMGSDVKIHRMTDPERGQTTLQ